MSHQENNSPFIQRQSSGKSLPKKNYKKPHVTNFGMVTDLTTAGYKVSKEAVGGGIPHPEKKP